MTAPVAPAVDLTLDACAALQADLAALNTASSGPNASLKDAAPDAPAPAQPAAWLLVVTSIERAAQLTPSQRPAHFRRARAVWDDAAATLGAPRYAEVGARLARWRTADPTLPLVRHLLWAVEQPEAAGYTHLALAGYSAMATLVPADDVRRGYVLAQSARAVRTLGDVEGARERYAVSERLATRYRDWWLRGRSALGLGATYQQLGNHPEARAVFERILTGHVSDARMIAAAHHGLLLSANAAGDYDAALAHGWYLMRAGREGMIPRLDTWLLMAGICDRIGRYRAATRLAAAVLREAERPDDVSVALQILVRVATVTLDRELGRRHAPSLRATVGRGASRFDDVRALLTLAAFLYADGDRPAAHHDLQAAREVAQLASFHELVFRADQLEADWAHSEVDESRKQGSRVAPAALSHEADHIARLLDEWDGDSADNPVARRTALSRRASVA